MLNRFRLPLYFHASAFEIQTSADDRRCQLNRGGQRTLNPLRKKLWERVCGIALHFERCRIRLTQFSWTLAEFRTAVCVSVQVSRLDGGDIVAPLSNRRPSCS